MRKRISVVVSILIFMLGFGVMFYPTFSNWVHEQSASYAISDYQKNVSNKSLEEAEKLFANAREYNGILSGDVYSFILAEQNKENEVKDELYWNTFDDMNGIIGVVDIPTINVKMPIYHGTDESSLQKGVGHLEGSALPTGDLGIHTVLTGHTGLPEAELFTNLDQLVVGDSFYVKVLNQVFTYEVKEIYVVLPSDDELLQAQEDRNLVTLVTCTPYGVNSHRLLVMGEMIATDIQCGGYQNQFVVKEIVEEKGPVYYLPIIIGFSLIILVGGIAVFFGCYKNKRRQWSEKY